MEYHLFMVRDDYYILKGSPKLTRVSSTGKEMYAFDRSQVIFSWNSWSLSPLTSTVDVYIDIDHWKITEKEAMLLKTIVESTRDNLLTLNSKVKKVKNLYQTTVDTIIKSNTHD